MSTNRIHQYTYSIIYVYEVTKERGCVLLYLDHDILRRGVSRTERVGGGLCLPVLPEIFCQQ